MKLRVTLFLTVAIVLAAAASGQGPSGEKRLIIHADDLGLAHSVNVATFKALDSGAVSSASVMVPCPWLTEAGEYARAHPDADIGIHLTLTAEWKNYRWGPVASRDAVSSLIDPSGYLWPEAAPAQSHAKAEEAAKEIRAQIDTARRMGIRPTHIDSHMGTLFSPALFGTYIGLAREMGIRFFFLRRTEGVPPAMANLLRDSDEIPTAFAMANNGWKADRWFEHYEEVIQNLKPGLTELIVHLAYDDAEMQAITAGHPAYGSAWRQRDLDVLTSSRFRKVLEASKVRLVGWKDLKPVTQ